MRGRKDNSLHLLLDGSLGCFNSFQNLKQVAIVVVTVIVG